MIISTGDKEDVIMFTRIRMISALLAIVIAHLPLAASAQDLTSREYPYLYKSSRAMGMGGAYTAIGGRVDTLFYNPAGLANIPRDKGWEVNLINVSAEAGKNTMKFVRDMQRAFDLSTDDEQLKAVNDVLSDYRGKNLHVRAADFTSIGKNNESFAFGAGALASGRLDAASHQGFGPEGILEVNADATYGGIVGFSLPLSKRFDVGLSVKALHRESVIKLFTAREIVDNQNNLDNYITKDLRKQGDAVGFDAGALYKFSPGSWWRPSAGVSVMNIGDLDFKEAGKIPMTVNAGLAVNPKISAFRSLLIGVDYVDITNNFSQDKDMAKRLRYGAELQLFDITPIELALRVGMYEGYPTFGADIRVLTFLFSYAMYSEEVGAYAGQDKDTRQLLTFNFGW